MIRVPRFRPSWEGKKLASHLVLRELGDELGVGPIELDSDGGTQLTFGQDLVVDLEELPGSGILYLSAPVGQLDGLITKDKGSYRVSGWSAQG
jgi:hypothetical protein